ncbi:MAG TPA: Gldg family protein, partial [Planctomycetota bacterium]|nr:Gldg family protein [Planctomycetota bacterium]
MSATTTPAGARRRNDFSDSPARVTTAIVALVGLLLIIVSIGMAAGLDAGWAWKYYTPVIVLGVGVLAVGFFAVFNIEWLGDLVSGRAALSGLLVAVMCLAAVVVWAAAAYFFSHKGQVSLPRVKKPVPLTKSWDMTKARKFTLSQKSIEQLKELTAPLQITVLGRLPDPETPYGGPIEGAQAEDLLAMYVKANPLVSLEYIRGNEEDAARRIKVLAEKLRRSSEELPFGTLVMTYKDQAKSCQAMDLWETRPYAAMGNQVQQGQVFKGEEVITSTILQMLDPRKPKVYFAWGHGERDPEGRDGKGLSFAQDRMQGDNMEAAKLMLVSAEKIPD